MPKEIVVNIDSRNRSTNPFSTPSNFNVQFNNINGDIQNIIGVKLSSAEISNSFCLTSNDYNNNYFTLHLPNIDCDPSGLVIKLAQGVPQTQEQYMNAINMILSKTINTNKSLSGSTYSNSDFAEKYFYIFYAVNSIYVQYFFYNDSYTYNNNNPISNDGNLYTITLNSGWYSMYGLVNKIISNIQNNPNSMINFVVLPFQIPVFDRRLRYNLYTYDNDPHTYMLNDCVRFDQLPYNNYNNDFFDLNNNNFSDNLTTLKTAIYSCYVYDIKTFNVQNNKDTPNTNNGILDDLKSGTYMIPSNYLTGGDLFSLDPLTNKLVKDNINGSPYLTSYSVYYVNNMPTPPRNGNSVQLYNILSVYDKNLTQFSFINSYNPEVNPNNTLTDPRLQFYYYYIDNLQQGWNPDTETIGLFPFTEGDNVMDSLNDLDFLSYYNFITDNQYYDPNYIPSLQYDIPDFQINFKTGLPNKSNRILYVDVPYLSLGTLLGFDDTSLNIPSMNSTNNYKVIFAININQLYGSYYINLRIGTGNKLDWGMLGLDIKNTPNGNNRNFAKILLPAYIASDYGTYASATSIINPIYIPDPLISSLKNLSVQLTDYNNNILNTNGVEFSFTLIFICEDKDPSSGGSIGHNSNTHPSIVNSSIHNSNEYLSYRIKGPRL